MSNSFHEKLGKVATPAVAADIAAKTRDLAASLSVVLASAPENEARNLLDSLVLAICNEIPAFHKKPDAETSSAETSPPSIPVPDEVIEQALRDFDDEATVEAVRRVRESGGLSLDDFYGDLERLLRA